MLLKSIGPSLSKILPATRNCELPTVAVAWEKCTGQSRCLHSSSNLARFWESNPRGEYHDVKLDEEFQKKSRKNLWGLKDGLKILRTETTKWAYEWKEHLVDDSRFFVRYGDKDKIFDFREKETFKKWFTLSDSDHNEGFSRCEFLRSPTGKGIFHGFVNSKPPKDGRVKTSGYCILRSERPMLSFGRKSYLNWEDYTHLIMRVRGDGRSYVINISTAGYYDITWNDSYHYVLYTRGGPYWQDVKIPFGKFVFGSKGRVQDHQMRIPQDRIASVGFAVHKIDGPFALEIDHISLECDPAYDEHFAYETYRIPKFVAGV